MNARAAAAACALCLIAAACAGTENILPAADGEISVEIFSGLSASGPALGPGPEHFLVDITPLMTPELSDGPLEDQLQLARTLALPYLRDREKGAPEPEFHVFNRLGQRASECAENAGAGTAASEALGRLREDLAKRNQAASARVVLFANFDQECAPRLCAAASKLVEPGTWLDLVRLGSDAKPPECLEQVRPSVQGAIPWLSSWTRATQPAFIVEAVNTTQESVIGRGMAGGPAIAVSPGLRRIRVDLNPPEIVGPVRVRPGDKLRLRILDFPLSAPNARSWLVEPADEKR